jgi:predicted DCC family thiol-disulfide oxidoreductase YuxK
MREPHPEFTLLYDGDCPLCSREVAVLRRRDRRRGALALVDIAAPGFDPARYGRTRETLMARIHGVLPDGTVIEGMEVFRRAYAAVGLGWVLAPSRWPVVGRAFDAAYEWFARNRLRLTGRADECAGARSRRTRAPAPRRTRPAPP